MLFNIKRFSQIYYFLFLLIFLTGAGTTGYAIIEDWGFIDSLYMTTITISTVGFKEVQELSDTDILIVATGAPIPTIYKSILPKESSEELLSIMNTLFTSTSFFLLKID